RVALLPRSVEALRQAGIQVEVTGIAQLIAVAALTRVWRPITLVSRLRIREQVWNAARAACGIRTWIYLSNTGTVTSHIPVGLPAGVIKEPINRIPGVVAVDHAKLPTAEESVCDLIHPLEVMA